MTQHRRLSALTLTAPRTDIPKEYRINDTDSDYLTIPHGTDINFNSTDSFTWSIYVKFETSAMGSFVPLMSKRPSSGTGIQLFKSDADQWYSVVAGATNTAIFRGTEVLLPNKWYLISWVYGGATTSQGAYLNGKLDVTNLVANPAPGTVTNTAVMALGSRLNSPIYEDIQIGRVYIHNRVLDVNEIPDKMWNYGKPRTGTYVSGCVRDYDFINDVFSTNYLVKDKVTGGNGASVNMNGTELVSMNSVMVPVPEGIQCSPYTTTQNFIGWDSAGLNAKYDVDVSNDGTTGWVTLASNLDALSYIHNVGTASTQRFYRVRARGVGTTSAYTSVVDATTLSSSYPDVFYLNTRRLADNSYNFGLSVETQRVAPQGYYDSQSDKTYFVFMSRAELGYNMAIFAYYYDHASATFSDPKYVGLKTRQGLDRHPIPACIVADDGHIIVSSTDFHNAELQMYRSDNPGSIDSFTRLGEIGVVCDYPEFRKFSNGDIAVFCRYYDLVPATDLAGFGAFFSTDDGLTWSAMVRILEYTYSVGRPYPMLMPQSEASDRVHILVAVRNDTGGPFGGGDPDDDGYFKDYGYAYSDYLTDGITTWRNVNNAVSTDVSVTPISTATWQASYQFHDSIGTQENGLPVGIVTAAGNPFIATFNDGAVYKVAYWNGSSWTSQTVTWSDGIAPDSYTFGYHGIQAIVHVSGTTFDIYCTKSGVVKWYRTTDNFANATLQDANFLPDVDGLAYERGTTTHNIYQAAEPFIFYSIKKSEPTPLPTSPGAWSDIVLKKLW